MTLKTVYKIQCLIIIFSGFYHLKHAASDRRKVQTDLMLTEQQTSPSRVALPGHQLSMSNAPGAAGLRLYLSSLIARRLRGELRYQTEMPSVRFVLWLPI